MTLEELCDKYNLKPSTVQSNFKRTQEALLKKHGIKIIKEGRGSNALYKEMILSDNRAESIFQALEPVRQTGIIRDDLKMSSFTFCVFMGIITTPMLVFRGTYNDFLRYIEVSVTDEHISFLKEAINKLVNECIIHCLTDTTTNEEVITLSLVRKAEIEMKIGVDMIRVCKQLSEQYHKRDWIPILKVWLGTELLSQQDYYTKKELEEMTGLSKYQLDESTRILKESNIYKTSRAYAGYQKCLGLTADMNIKDFYNF